MNLASSRLKSRRTRLSLNWLMAERSACLLSGRGGWRARCRPSAAGLRLSGPAKESIGLKSTKTSALGGCCRGHQRAHQSKSRQNAGGHDQSRLGGPRTRKGRHCGAEGVMHPCVRFQVARCGWGTLVMSVISALLSAGILAVVDLAMNEPPAVVTRELVYCRFPLVDGAGNPPWILRAAIDAVAGLLRSGVPTLLYCGAGMSRSPAIAAAVIVSLRGCSLSDGLATVAPSGALDISPGFLAEVQAVLAGCPAVT